MKNKVQLIGKISSPNINVVSSSFKIADILLETEEAYRNTKGEIVNHTMLHKCRAYDKLADFIDKYVTKGIEVAIEGTLIQSSYSVKGKFFPETYVQLKELLILDQRK